jgi:anhydro-N-acetylmuramic acid kinase
MPSSGLYIGIMSGTSLDGVDAALCRFSWESELPDFELLAEATIQWPAPLRQLLYKLATEESVSMDTLTRVHFLLSQYYAESVRGVLDRAKRTAEDISAIGIHGQTVRHLPGAATVWDGGPSVSGTLQLGSGPALAALTGIDVVSDFRSADIALGGQGAPLVPIFDNAFLRSPSTDRVALNIGGISNITWLPSDPNSDVVAFDTGPGNMIVDALVQRYFDRPFDRDGEIAARGAVDREVLARLLSHSYFRMPPPKSTGRELFGQEFLGDLLHEVESRGMRAEDAVATATELTARSIADAIQMLTHNSVEVLAAGGGAKNLSLLERLRAMLTPSRVTTTETVGIPVQSKEAIAFAFFAFARMHDRCIHLPATTGASHAILLGSVARGRV